MPEKVRNVLNDEHTRPEDSHVIRHHCQNAVVGVLVAMMAVPELAKPLARWPRCDKLDVADELAVGLYKTQTLFA